jgi:hypothetical protein
MQWNPKLLGIALQKNLTLLDFNFFNIFYVKKLTRSIAPVIELISV